ncbi:MAG: RNA polymerase sigma factor [Gemmatimonadota bacterium]
MSETAIDPGGEALAHKITRAKDGDRAALESVIRAVQPDVYQLALRFLWHPQDAEDATQEILIRVITRLASFRGESSFRTWVYRVACNALLTLRKQRMEHRAVSFEEFGEDLAQGLSDEALRVETDPDRSLLLEEVKIGCTTAMLLCLDRNHRMAYILGEILELDHNEAADVLEITPAAFRKRLSRARASVMSFMMSHCGLINTANACRCHWRVDQAVKLGRVDAENLLFASSLEHARKFPEVLVQIRQLDETRRAAALYRSHPGAEPSPSFTAWLRQAIA